MGGAIGNVYHDSHCGPIRFGTRREFLMKNCARCEGRFDRIPGATRKLKDGTRLDVNSVCPSCEAALVREAFEFAQQRQPTSEELARWDRECLRKNAFTSAHLARNVAKAMRRRHKGAMYPVDVYRCKVAIDPILFPDRAHEHWHIGGVEKP
jgi:hypothetical protein